MLNPPEDLAEDDLTAGLTRHWGVAVASMAYRAVGFGSHHWAVTDPTGGGWFATVDDLEMKRRAAADPLDLTYAQLRMAFDAARALRATGAAFVVAPVPTAGGEPLARLTERYAAAVYPMVDGQSFEFGGYADDDHRDAVQKMVVAVHQAPESVRRRAAEDDFAVPHRDALEAAVKGVQPPPCGPYAAQTADLVADEADRIERLIARYDELAAAADRGRGVLTHGEPHGANTMRTADGWRLIDWDTTMVAPPERDLWVLGGDLTEYSEQTGIAVLPELLEMYRLRWDITDIAEVVDRFRRPHTGDANDDAEWDVLREIVGGISL